MNTKIEKSSLKNLSLKQNSFLSISRVISYPFIFVIFLYRKIISPSLPPTCRFQPTCSQYAIEALFKYGFFKGLYFSVKRIIKCNPFHKGGYDPLP